MRRPATPNEPAPFVALYRQIRGILSDLLKPIIAGIFTTFLLISRPTRAILNPKSNIQEPAQFLLFAILIVVVAESVFNGAIQVQDEQNTNANQRQALQATLEAQDDPFGVLAIVETVVPQAGLWISQGRTVLEPVSNAFQEVFLDQNILKAITELVKNLGITFVLAYLFRVLAGRSVNAGIVYAFYLYMKAMEFLTVALASILLTFPIYTSLDILPNLVQWQGWATRGAYLLWQFVIPFLLLRRLFPQLGWKRGFVGNLVAQLVVWGGGAIIAGISFLTLLLLTNLLSP